MTAAFSVAVELRYDAAWNDITAWVKPGVEISRGFRQGRGSGVADPQTCRLTLDNTDGRFSPRNPRSPLFGKIGRNTELRVRVTSGAITRTRFSGEVSEWPTAWNRRGDVLVDVTATGPLRRLGRLSEDPQSPLRTVLSDPANGLSTVGYWPLEDGSENVGRGASFGSGLPGGRPLAVQQGRTGEQRSTGWAGSRPLPRWGNAWGTVDFVAPKGIGEAMTVWLLIEVPETVASTATIGTWYFRGSCFAWRLEIDTSKRLRLSARSRTNTTLLDTGFVDLDVTTGRWRVGIEADRPSGFATEGVLVVLEEGSDFGASVAALTAGSETIGTFGGFELGSFDGDLGDVGIGHVFASSQRLSIYDANDQLKGFAGESPGDRFQRIAAAAGVTSTAVFGATSQTMGAQPITSVVDILRDTAAVEGVITDRMTSLGLVWRGEADRTDPAVLEMDYAALHVSDPFTLVDDDDLLVNDSTVTRDGGVTARVTVDTGPLSTQDPPDGVGRYAEAVTLNLGQDADAVQHAAWRTAVGTHDEARAVSIVVDFAANPDLIDPMLTAAAGGVDSLDIFDVIEVANLPEWVPPRTVRASVLGWVELLDPGGDVWTCRYFTEPQAPHDYLVLDGAGDLSRIDCGSSTLATDVTDSATSLSVAVTSSERWVTTSEDATAFPFDILVGGEVMTVTAISGTSSPQTFTVTRGVESGFSAAHTTGDSVSLARPRRVAFP